MTEQSKTALVTGANRGIGYETARLLGERGYTVLVAARDAENGEKAAAELRAGGADAHAIQLDVADEESARRAAGRVGKEYGRLDVLVNNAGIGGFAESGAPSQTSLATLRTVFETNVFGVVTVTNALLSLLREARAARIVNVSSEVGSIAAVTHPDSPLSGLPAVVPYPASKTALNMVTVMYAGELRDTPIKVNAANPGYCATDFNGHSGFRTATQGAEVCVHLATLPPDGPSGVLWGDRWTSGEAGANGVLSW